MRGSILAVATHLFAARGYAGTSLQAIADAVGVRKPSLLHPFSSEGAIRDAALDSLLSHWRERLPQVLTAATTGRDRFDGVLREVIGFFDAEPDRARLLVREVLDRPGEMRAQFAPCMSLLTSYIDQGREAGRIHTAVDAEAYVTEVILLAVSHFALGPASQAVDPDPARAPRTGDWEARRLAELRRLCSTALVRARPDSHVAASTAGMDR